MASRYDKNIEILLESVGRLCCSAEEIVIKIEETPLGAFTTTDNKNTLLIAIGRAGLEIEEHLKEAEGFLTRLLK